MFEMHRLNDEGMKEVAAFKAVMNNAFKEVDLAMPDSREKSVFKTKLEEAVFFGTKAIASKPGNYTEIVTF